MTGFLMNLSTAEEFYTRCIEQNANTEEAKLTILKALTKELKSVKLNQVDLERYFKNKRVLQIKKKG